MFIRELARQLGMRDHKVDIYTHVRDSGHGKCIRLSDNVRLIHLKAGNNGHLYKQSLYPYLGDFFRELERFTTQGGLQYNLIHSHYWLSGRVGNWAQDRWGVPHAVMFHTLAALKNRTGVGEPEPELRLTTERKLVKGCQRILAPTRKERDNLIKIYGANPDKIGIVPCGVDLDLFRPIDTAEVREELGLDSKESVVLYVGRFEPLKGIDRLLEAMTYFKKHQHFRLMIIGGDGRHAPESQKLRTLSRKLGIQNAVTFVGRIPQTNLPPYYSAADVVVVPSHYESFGLVGLESLACGTPVVSTEVGALPSILRPGENGLVVADSHPRALAEGIEGVIAERRSNGLSTASVRATVLKFGWPNVAATIVKEYTALVENQSLADTPNSVRSGFVFSTN